WQVVQSSAWLRWLPVAVLSRFACFFASSLIIQFLPANRWVSLTVVVAAIFLFRTLFRDITETQINRSAPPANWLAALLSKKSNTLMFRANIAAGSLLLVTGPAAVVGPARPGLVAALRVRVFTPPRRLHVSYGTAVVSATIKHYPDGIGALVVYALAVSYLYPLLGLHWGTASSLLCSVAYLLVYGWLRARRQPA